MSTLSARVSSQRQLAYVPHTSVDGEAWELTHKGVTTSNGAADGTTIIDASADSGGADTYNGRYWVRIMGGSALGERKRIVDDDGSGTLTLENNGFKSQVVSGVNYEIWKSPEPVVVVDSSSGETNLVDAVRTEADDYWNDFYIVPITGSRRGRIAKVTGWDNGTTTFTLAVGLGGALSAGDVCLIRKYVEAGDVSLSLEHAYEPTPTDRLDGSRGDGRVTRKSGTVSFATEVTSLPAASGSGTAAKRPLLGQMMQAAGLAEVIGTGSTVGAGSTTSAVKIATGSWENHPIGSPVIYGGQLAWVVSTEDGGGSVDTINVAPPFANAPVDGDTIRAGITYRTNRSAEDGDYCGITLEYEMDGVRVTMTGCRGTVGTVDGERVMLQWELQVDDWVREIERAPYYAGGAYVTDKLVLATERLCYIDTSKANMGGITFGCNNEVAAKNVQGSSGINGRNGFGHVVATPGGTFRQLLLTDGVIDADTRYNVRTAFAWSVIYGAGYREAFGMRMPQARVIENPAVEDADGMIDTPNVVEAQDPGTTTLGDDTIERIAEFMLSFG